MQVQACFLAVIRARSCVRGLALTARASVNRPSGDGERRRNMHPGCPPDAGLDAVAFTREWDGHGTDWEPVSPVRSADPSFCTDSPWKPRISRWRIKDIWHLTCALFTQT